MSVNAQQDVKPISPYIYGINQFRGVLDGLPGPWSNATFLRLGGNRFTAYNWTNNASNAGSDYHFQSDDYLVSGEQFNAMSGLAGGACIPTIQTAAAHHAATLLTLPINGYVAADKLPEGDVRASHDFIDTRFKREYPRKGSAFSLTPDIKSPVVYQDEFVNWVAKKFAADSAQPLWFSLDNEPDWWSHTHPEIHPAKVTYAELLQKSIAYSSAAKDVLPSTLIFGPANYGWQGFVQLQSAPDATLGDFQSYYLQQMAAAEKVYGKRLLDVLDVHWYPEATGGGVRIMGRSTTTAPAVKDARMQAPRSLWDPAYVETSWITRDSLKGPITLLPRLQEKIAKNYPGTKLAITEYDFGGGTDISGAVAEADVLGIFGRDGVFAAAVWPGRNIPYIGAGFEMFRNFDAAHTHFGDISIHAQTSDNAATSIYASVDSKQSAMVIVVINKKPRAVQAIVQLNQHPVSTQAQVFQLTDKAPHPCPAGVLSVNGESKIDYMMPAESVTTILLPGK